jgi:adiponectin receptor
MATTRQSHQPPREPSRLDTSVKLHDSHHVPSWYAHNAFILTGYRPVTKSIPLCIRSLSYLHNETVNIYSHLIPGIIVLLTSYSFDRYFSARFPEATWADEVVFRIFLTTSVICFGTSAAYHTLICHSEIYASLWVRLDYVAIIMQIIGSFIPGIYFGFYCEPRLQKLYWSMIVTLGTLTATTVINPSLQGPRWKILRLSTFVATGFSAFAPILHGALLFPYDQFDKQTGLRYYYLEGILLLIGVGFYATHFPESCRPKRYDIWGASHQVFHIFIVLSAMAHYYGIISAFEWNYVNQRCQWS